MDWIEVLRAACADTTQAAVARRLGYRHSSVVSQVLAGKYRGRLDRVEARVRGELMRLTLACPVLGEISTRQCQDEQRKPFAATSHVRVALYKACRGCGHANQGDRHDNR